MSSFSNETFAIMSGNKKGWKAVGTEETDKASSSSFYTINSVAYVLMKPNVNFFPVEPSFTQDYQICWYFHSNNKDVWIKGGVVKVQVINSCEIRGYTMAKLKEHRCENMITGKDCYTKYN